MSRNLSHIELKLLVMLSDQIKPSEIETQLGIDRKRFRQLEKSIKKKLEANNKRTR